MSGHSHWATIKRKKGTEDQKRGQIFSRLSREITIAAKSGADSESNARLRLAIERARTANMPKSNIEKAIKKATGEGKGGGLEEVIYEGFGPGGIGIMVEALTDNRKRTTAEIRKIFEKRGGSLAGPGAVAHQFQRMGFLAVSKGRNSEQTVLRIMDLKIEDVDEVEDEIEVYVEPANLETVKKQLADLGLEIKSFSLTWRPLTPIIVKKKSLAEPLLALLDELENHDDVQTTDANL